MTETAFQEMSATETTELMATLHRLRISVLFKFVDSGVYRAKAAAKGWGQNILVARPANMGQGRNGEIVTGNFIVDEQLYFFNARVRTQGQSLHLQLTGELHKLIRRKQNRVAVPPSFPLYFVTKRWGDRLLFVRGVVQDLSIKGARVALNTSQYELKKGEVISGLIRFGSRRPIVVSGIVRHHRRLAKGRFDLAFGLEFTKVEDPNRLQSWLVDLQREAFRRL